MCQHCETQDIAALELDSSEPFTSLFYALESFDLGFSQSLALAGYFRDLVDQHIKASGGR